MPAAMKIRNISRASISAQDSSELSSDAPCIPNPDKAFAISARNLEARISVKSLQLNP